MGFNLRLPTVLGHEVGGVVEEVGPNVRTVKVGDRVTIPFHDADGVTVFRRAAHLLRVESPYHRNQLG